MLPIGREQDVLLVMVLTGVLTPLLNLGLHFVNLSLHIVNGVRRLCLVRNYLTVKGGPNLGPL
jgi:hypothetical protein